MSRVGKQIINIPSGTTVKIDGGVVSVAGPQGTLAKTVRPEIKITVEGNRITLAPAIENVFTRKLWGTYASHLKNMIKGVNEPFAKKLIIEGIGFKADASSGSLVLNLGFSHPVNVAIPQDLKVTTEKGTINISGADKERVGEFAARVRALKEPEPYKGKGIRYSNEVVRRKAGKKAAAA
jgi:large subunit ribosomal protein L6